MGSQENRSTDQQGISVFFTSSHKIADLLKGISWIIILLSFIIGYGVMADLGVLGALFTIFSIIIIAIMVLGFEEIIDLLYQVNERQKSNN